MIAEEFIRAEIRFESPVIEYAKGALTSFVDLCSAVFLVKWEIGAGNTYSYLDPNNISFPRTSKEWRMEWEWAEWIQPQLMEMVSKDLNLEYHRYLSFSSESGMSWEEYRHRSDEYHESGKSAKEA